ncbi:TPA: hypothetical protein DEP90_00050, partial [Patescibacteria group bacterium]|nr:hypothetical protein [Patescibacteria group bacterium]
GWVWGPVNVSTNERLGYFTVGEGTYGFRVRAVDNEGHYSEWSSVDFTSSCKVTYDETSPEAPTNLRVLNYQGDTLGCGGYTNNRRITVDWDASTSTDVAYYRYDIIDENDRARFPNTQYTGDIRNQDGYYEYRVWAVDYAGNLSEDSTGWCGVTLDRLVPVAPTGLSFYDADNLKIIQCGGYSNTRHITEHWNRNTTEANFSHYEYSSFNAPLGTQGIVARKFLTNYFDSSWWNIPIEGVYGFQVRSLDLANNISDWALSSPAGFDNSCKINIDWTAPVVEIVSPKDDGKIKGEIDLIGDIEDDNLWRYYYQITSLRTNEIITSKTVYADSLVEEVFYKWNTLDYPDGNYKIHLAARDKANNRDSSSEDAIIVIVENDSDHDGVLNGDDLCPETVADTLWNEDMGTNRWMVKELKEYGLQWYQNKPRGEGWRDDGLAYTYGCNGKQILTKLREELELEMNGHWFFGLSSSVLDHFHMDYLDGDIDGYNKTDPYDENEVLSDGSIRESVMLEEGKTYLLKAYDTFYYTSGKWADPEYYLLGFIVVKGDTEGSKPHVLDVSINGYTENIDWGGYKEDHIYYKTYIGKEYPITFSIYDSAYGDNSGSLFVDIFEFLY